MKLKRGKTIKVIPKNTRRMIDFKGMIETVDMFG